MTQEQPQEQAQAQAQAQEQQLLETLGVEDLDTFVRILTGWHTEKCATVQHLLEVPEGTAFEIGDESLVLEGAALAGFKFGIEMAMMQLGKLPFVAEFEEEASVAG